MEGNCQNDLLKDDASSIEILPESGDSRNSEWSIYSPSRSSFAGSETSLMDFQRLSIDCTTATTVHHDGRQFIERRDLDDGGLPYSAEFYLNGEVWKLSGEDCFLMSPRRYIAEVTVENATDMVQADGFEEAIRTLLKHLKVERVILDKEFEECNKAKGDLSMTLDKLTDGSGEHIDRKRDVMLLRMMLRKHGNSLNIYFIHDLRKCLSLSSDIMSKIDNYVTKVMKLIQRNEFLGQLNDCSLSDEFIIAAIQEALNRHRARLAAICPSSMKDKLNDLSDDRILYVTMDDMHLFTDLTKLKEATFEVVWPIAFSKFVIRAQEISDDQFAAFHPLSNRIFLYVCKSMQEIAQQLDAHDQTGKRITYSEALGWEVTDVQVEPETSYIKCLRQQLHMLAKLANHFEPGGPFRTSRFPYEFKLFQNMDSIPEPVRVWLCLLDDCMKDLVEADHDKMQMLSCFFKSYVSFIASEDFRSETLECLRAITHDALRSLAEVSSSQHDRPTMDWDLSEYDKMICCCVDQFHREHFANECFQIETTLRQIICCKAIDMNIPSDELSRFLSGCEQLLNDLSDLQLEWFIQLAPSDKRNLLLRSQCIVPEDSIWKGTDCECFKVVDLEGFVEMFKHLYIDEEMPKHYQLEAIQALLHNLQKLTSKQKRNDGNHLDALIVMINSIRSSLQLLKEQPDNSRFEDFLLKMSKSCAQVIRKKVQELPYTEATDFGEELALIDRLKSSKLVLLENGLNIFKIQFNKHIAESAQLSREKRIEKIVFDVKSKVEPNLAANWSEEFKQNELPEVLAGLSAVWSIVVPEYDSSSENVTIIPSYLQICCVLSIFDDQEEGGTFISYPNIHSPHQSIQISIQEGKEFVLGLTAALLALNGHKVQIVCFNRCLTRINSLDWIKVFRSFSILSNVSYISLEDVGREGSRDIYEKYIEYTNECLGLETNSKNDNEPKNSSDDGRYVLLIEDLDILLQEDVLMGSLTRFERTPIPGLKEVQRKLLSHSKPVEVDEIDQYIMQSDNPNIRELRAFLDRPHSYKIFEGSNSYHYTNKTLFFKHLDAMQNTKTMGREYCADFSPAMTGNINCGYLSVGNIDIPLPHLLRTHPLLLGFTSTPYDSYCLTNYYGIFRTVAETFQTNPTKFNPTKDFLFVDSGDDRDWTEAIIAAVKAAVDRNCLVLVFFNDAQKMDQFRQTEYLKQLNVTAIKMASNLFIRNNTDYEISVLMVCGGHFAKDRHVHVIQTFFSNFQKEEDLIRRYAERRNSSGSYELIIARSNTRCLPENAGKEEITYDWLVNDRRQVCWEDINYSYCLSMHGFHDMKRFLGYD